MVIVAGHAAAVLAIIVLTINLFVGRWLSSAQKMFLWGLVLVRMVMPGAPATTMSIHHVVKPLYEGMGSIEPINSLSDLISDTPSSSVHRSHKAASEIWTNARVDSSVAYDSAATKPRTSPANAHNYSRGPAIRERSWSEFVFTTLPYLWLAGVLLVLCLTVIIHWRFSRRMARAEICDDSRLLTLWRDCRKELLIPLEIPVILSDDISQPAILGLWRPRLLLSRNCLELSDDELRIVMLHELMHVKRADVAVNWLLVLVRSLQWWNPVFWLAQSQFFNLREQSRDAMVLRHLDASERERRMYGELLLSLAQRGTGSRWRVMLPASLLGFIPGWFRKRVVANRLRAMSRATRPQRYWHRGIAVMLIGMTALIGMTDAREPEPDIEPVYSGNWRRIIAGRGESTVFLNGLTTEFIQAETDNNRDSWKSRTYDISQGAEIVCAQQGIDLKELPHELAPGYEYRALSKKQAVISSADSGDALRGRTTGTEPEISEDLPTAQVHWDGERWSVIVNGPPEIHRQLSETVRAFNRSGYGQVAVETRIYMSQHDVMEAAGLSWDRIQSGRSESSLPAKNSEDRIDEITNSLNESNVLSNVSRQYHSPVMIAVLDNDQLLRFIKSAFIYVKPENMFAPKLTLRNGQSGRLYDGVQRPFVVGVNQQEGGNLKPDVRIIEEGTSVKMRLDLTEDHTAVDLVAAVEMSKISDVQTFTTQARGQRVTVQVPNVDKIHVETSSQLTDGETLLLCIPPVIDQHYYNWVLLTPRIIADAVERTH
ncbi:M56 family metallopeptidase [Rubinisphaera brasiliensis]